MQDWIIIPIWSGPSKNLPIWFCLFGKLGVLVSQIAAVELTIFLGEKRVQIYIKVTVSLVGTYLGSVHMFSIYMGRKMPPH